MATTHYDPLFLRKRQVLPMIIRDELTRKQRQVILMYYTEKLSDAQIAETLSITVPSAQRLRRRAEYRIARCLRYCGDSA